MTLFLKFQVLHVTLPLPHINVESGQVLFPKAKTFANNIDLGEQGLFHWKRDFLFCLKGFVQDLQVIDIFWEKRYKLLNGIEMHVGALHALNLINSKL